MPQYTILHGDCREQLKNLPDNSVDSIVTDPPYGLEFMGKDWDAPWKSDTRQTFKDELEANETPYGRSKVRNGMGASYNSGVQQMRAFQDWCETWAAECFRVLKPGGHMLAFSGSRTYHRMTSAIEDAGFEIRDQIMWIYGSGFPKSLNVSKAIDKAAGAERKVLETKVSKSGGMAHIMKTNTEQGYRPSDYYEDVGNVIEVTEPATDDAKKWDGWGTALKPAHEPICVARKPLEGTVAANVLKYGTGAINIDESRVETNPDVDDPRLGGVGSWSTDKAAQNVYEGGYAGEEIESSPLGRWPANIIHDGSEEVVKLFPQSKGQQGDVRGTEPSHTGDENANTYGEYKRVAFPKRKEGGKGGMWSEGNGIPVGPLYGDGGSAARFFYSPKASKADRDIGLDNFVDKKMGFSNGAQIHGEGYDKGQGIGLNKVVSRKNIHPTVKPTELMKYLVRMVTPKDGTVLDPFMGSGSTGRGAMLGGYNFIGIEMTDEYIPIATARIEHAKVEYEAEMNKPFNKLFEVDDE